MAFYNFIIITILILKYDENISENIKENCLKSKNKNRVNVILF